MVYGIIAGLVCLAALVALGFVTWRTWVAVRDFSRDVAAASERMADATAALEAVMPQEGPRR